MKNSDAMVAAILHLAKGEEVPANIINQLQRVGNVTKIVGGELARHLARRTGNPHNVQLTDDSTPQLAGDLDCQGNDVDDVGFLNFGTLESVTISSGAITVTQSSVGVTAEAAASDDLDTINGTADGDIIILTREGAQNVVVKDGTDNLRTAGDFTMDGQQDYIMLINRGGTNLYELARSSNV